MTLLDEKGRPSGPVQQLSMHFADTVISSHCLKSIPVNWSLEAGRQFVHARRDLPRPSWVSHPLLCKEQCGHRGVGPQEWAHGLAGGLPPQCGPAEAYPVPGRPFELN